MHLSERGGRRELGTGRYRGRGIWLADTVREKNFFLKTLLTFQALFQVQYSTANGTFSFLRALHTDFHSGCTDLLSHQTMIKNPLILHLSHYFLSDSIPPLII